MQQSCKVWRFLNIVKNCSPMYNDYLDMRLQEDGWELYEGGKLSA